MSDEKIVTKNMGYMLLSFLAPVALIVVGMFLTVKLDNQSVGSVVSILLFAAAVGWWSYGSPAILKKSGKKLEKLMDEQGLNRNMTFNGKNAIVIVDVVHGKLGLTYRWNPMKQYIIPASRVEKAWVDDGKSGKGITEGSARVGFLFTVDGVTNRVDTFVSNQRFKMTDNRILTGISKADSVVEAINAAKAAN